MFVGRSEEVKCRAEEVIISNKDFEDGIEVFCTGPNVEFKNCVECFEGFLGQICIPIYLDDVSEERWGNGMIKGLEAREDIVHERELARAAQFENKGVIGSIGMPKVGLT